MTENLSLGKKGKSGEIDFSKIKSGIKKKDLLEGIEPKLKSVFEQIINKIDSNPDDNMLSREELQSFYEELDKLSKGNGNLSSREARKYQINGENIGRKGKDALFAVLNKLTELSKDVKEITHETVNGQEIEVIKYNDNKTEKIFPDGSRIIVLTNGKKVTSTKYDKNDKRTEESITVDNGTVTTSYAEDGETKTKEVFTNSQDNDKTTILYKNNEPATRTVEKNGNIENFVMTEINGKKEWQLQDKTETVNGVQQKTVYEYDKNGNKITEKITTSGKTIERFFESNGTIVEIIKSEGQPDHTMEYDSDGNYTDKYIDGNANVTDRYNSENTHIEQTRVVGDNTYSVNYDENGNTLGVIVQNGESIQQIANKFGVSVKDLIKANASKVHGKYPNAYFNVGEEIKIPRKMNADERVLQGRKTREEVLSDYTTMMERRAEEARRREHQAKLDQRTVIAKGKNGYYAAKDGYGNIHFHDPKGNEISAEAFKQKCPTMYKQITEADSAEKRGATKRTRNKYDTNTIKKEAGQLAEKIHNQISGASQNTNTINLLRAITPENAAFVISEYQRKFGVSLAKDIDDEWGLDINTVKEHICKKLVDQAKSLGISGVYYGDYKKINDLQTLQNWVNNVSSKIINNMSNAKETYYATDAEEVTVARTRENKKLSKTSAQQIVNDLIDAAEGWNDVDKIKSTIARIDNPDELKEVNRLLTLKGYPPTDKYSAIENFIYKEQNHSAAHAYNSSDYMEQVVQKWINNGVLNGQEANEAQARMAARVLYDGGDGFGTDCEKIKKAVRMIKCPKPTGNKAQDNAQAREVYRLVNAMINKHNTFYGLGSPCNDLLDYCEGEMWESEVTYLRGILAETNAIQGKEKAQAIHDLTEEAVAGAGTNTNYLKQAIRGINSREDRIAVEAKLKEYCKKHNVKYQYEGQSPLQAILYDECDTFMGFSRDHKEIRKFNEKLIEQGAYNEQEIINLRAEQAALQIMEGDFANVKDAVQQIKDPKVYARMLQIFAKISGKSLADFFMAKLGQEKSDLVNAELAANSIIEGKEAADVAFRLILNSDYDKRAMGFKAIRNEEVATIVDGYLKTKGSSLAQELDKFNKEKAEYKEKAKFWDGLAKFILPPVVADTISDGYRENTDASDNMYVEAKTSQHLTKAQKSAYEMTVRIFEQKLNKMKEDYQKALDSQGVVSGAINAFCEAYGLGTTREEIEARIEHDTETLRLLKLAAEGKLAKVENGKTVAVSFEEVFAERNVGTNFDAAKVEKVAKQAETMVAMDYAKENIAICWDELSSAKTAQQLAVAIYDAMEKISAMTGRTLTLEAYNYSLKDGIIVDASGKPVPAEKLQEIANQLKQGLADIAKELLGVDISLNTSSSKISDILSDGYDKKLESFKQEFKDAFGQDVPDEMLEDYMNTISTGMTVLNIGVMIGAIVAAPFTGGGSLAVFTMTAAASMGLNALENSTDSDGYTNEEWTGDAQQALWDGALAAIGFKVGQFAEGFARGSQIVSSQNKWISWLSRQPKGGLTSKLASIPRNQLGKVASKAKEIADKIQAYSGKVGKNVLEARKAQILAKNPGANLNSVERASVLFARAEACGLEVTSDMAQSLVQTYCMTGEFDEESFLMALCMSLGANIVGHGVAAKTADQTPPPVPREKTTGTETLDVASSRGAAHPSDVHVGAKKAETIRNEVETALNNPEITGEELARIRKEVEALSDRNLRHELLAKIDNKAKSLEAPKQEVFNNARAEDLQNNINHIFERHNELNATDVRVLNEYIRSTDDINVLNELKDKLRQKEYTYGGVTANYKALYKSIDDRIKVLTPKPEISNEEARSYIYSMLNSDKGMLKEEVEQLLDYIKGVQSADELKEIYALVGKKKMIGSYKKQLRAAIEERTNALKTADSAPKTEEALKSDETPKTDDTPKADEAPKTEDVQNSNETTGAKRADEAPKAENAANSDTAQKTYAEMNQDELFAEYYRLKMEVNYSPLSNADKAANINKMKEISTLLEQKGFRIEGDKLVKIKNEGSKSEAPKSEEADIEDVRPSYENPEKAMNLRKRLNAKLFAMYQGIEKSIENLKDLAGYNKIKTIIANQFKNSPAEFRELIMRLNDKAKKIGLKVVENTIDRTARMGKSLAKFYTKMENAIAKMTNEKQFNKILKKITTRFAGFYDDMKTLIDKLYERAKAIGLSVKESIQDVYKRVGIKTDGVSLDKYKPSGKGIDMSKSHDEWMNSRKDLFGNYSKEWGCWRSFDAKDQHHGAWKMHLYSVSEADWRKMCDVIIPYLKEHDIDWKTFGSGYGADYLNGSKQQGKAFTIYPKNNEDMAQIAKDLDYIIRNNKLETSGSHITGDAQLGSTGRLFYRYEFNSKQYQDEILDLNNPADRNKYIQYDKYGNQIGGYYDGNRGEGRHLANDMTPEDDIWRDFDPSDPNAQPYRTGGRTSRGANGTERTNNSSQNVDPNKARAYAKFDKNAPVYGLQQGQSVLNQSRQYVLDLNNLPRLTLLDGTTVDLNSTQIKNRIASLQEGEYITIGRQGDIRLNNAGNNVSRHHILITRHNGRIVMKDVSANGGTRCYSRAASQGANASGASGQANGASRGRTSTKAYTFNSMNDLKYQMREVLERFSINTQNKILHDLNNRGFCRLQKNGVEYLFVRRGNNVRLEEFNINAKYNIKETKIDDYNTQTTYDIDDLNDIWWAMSDKMPRFSPETQSYIINRLSNGETCRLRKGGIAYEFSIENGRITVKEQDYVRYNYDNGGRSESANGQNRSEGSSGSNRGQRANNSAGRMSDVQKQERIHTIESILERADDIEKFKTKFADIFSPDFKVTDEAGVQELKKITRFIKAFWHTDVGTGAPSDLQVICDELFNMTNGKYVVMGESRMGTPAEVNAMLDKLRELTNLDALRKELSELKG